MRPAAIVLALALLPTAGQALCPCTASIIDHSADGDANRNANADRIIAAVRAGAGQTSAYVHRSAAAAEKIQDASDLNAGLRIREGMRAAAEGGRYDPAASACGGLAGVMRLADGSRVGMTSPAGDDTRNRIRDYERCAGGNVEACAGPGAVASGIIADRDRSRNLGGVPDPTSDLRVLLRQPTAGAGSGTDPEALDAAVWRLSQNILNPFPDRPLTEAEARTPAGRALIAERQSEAARRSAPAALLGWIQTRSAPDLPLGGWARRTAPDGYPYPIDDKISLRQYYDVAAAASWRNPDWHARVMSMSPEAVAREIALQLALANDLAILQIELDIHRAAAEAVAAARLLDDDDG